MSDKKHDQPLSKPDPETMHTTDPQDHMEGPVSSFMHNLKENAEKSDVGKKGHDNENPNERAEETDRDDQV